MAKEVANGENHATTKPPPEPSPLRNAKFFQVQNAVSLILKATMEFVHDHILLASFSSIIIQLLLLFV